MSEDDIITRLVEFHDHIQAPATPTRLDALRGERLVRRRRTVSVLAAAAVAVLTVGIAQASLSEGQRTQEPAPQPSPFPSKWVLVTGAPIGTDFTPPVGDEWSKPLDEQGDNAYPYWTSVDPATRRFLINADDDALEVMTPDRAEPLVRFACGTACLGAALGPGPDEVTMVTRDFQLWVFGPNGWFRDTLGPAWTPSEGLGGFLNGFGWSPDGKTLAEAHYENGPDEASVRLVLRRPESAKETTLFEYSEAAPPWYHAEEHRFADWPGAINGWGAPMLARPGHGPVALQWAPDSTRLAFVTVATPEGEGGDRQVQWQLHVADIATGQVDTIADLGRCAEPVNENGDYAHDCDEASPSLAWTPDGESLTVLSDGSLTTYDLTGKVLDSEPTQLKGPLVWVEPE